jgi:hypothetical protein
MLFGLLDPRPIPAAKVANEKVFAGGPVLGIEVTVPDLAKQCVANIDPQHSGGDATRAAIEVALDWPIPEDDVLLATIKPDLDSVGAMAVLSLRGLGIDLGPAMERIFVVATADKTRTTDWPGVRTLPTIESPWGDAPEQPLAAIADAVCDFKISLHERVIMMKDWLLTGEEPTAYRSRVNHERMDMALALDAGRINVESNGKIAIVLSTHRAATGIGYMLAPVVVACNPEFRIHGGEPHRKYTVCQYSTGYCDMPNILAKLNALEPGWGGSPGIIGSPQGMDSKLIFSDVLEAVMRHIIAK